MLMKKKLKGAAIATAAAGLFLSGCATHGDHHGKMGMEMADNEVHCMGINNCKGQTSCKSAKNDCKGKNNCKGQGWLKASKADCEAKGGTVM